MKRQPVIGRKKRSDYHKRITVAGLITQAREKSGFTSKKAARLLGMTPHYLTHLEQEHPKHPVHLSERVAAKLVDKLGVSKRILLLRMRHNKKAQRYNQAQNLKRKKRVRQ